MRSKAFTLIELLISTALAMLLAAVAISTYYQVRRAVARAEAGMAMCDSAQTVYAYMHAASGSLQQSCAMAAYAHERGSAGPVPEAGEIRLVFMRGKEHVSDFVSLASAESSAYVRNDLTWEMWHWRRSDRTFSVGVNSWGDTTDPGRSFLSGAFTPVPATGAAVNYNGARFFVTPQPRRTLDWSSPMTGPSAAGLGFLDDNLLFPNASGVSMANPLSDIGDYTDVQNGMTTVLRNVADMSFVLVAHDGSQTTLDDAPSSFAANHAATLGWDVRQGVWLDGRLLTDRPLATDPPSGLPDASNYISSPLPKRPVLLRVVMTLEDPRWRNSSAPLSRTFTFSFPLPGLRNMP